MKRIITFLFALSLGSVLFAQTVDEIKNSNLYIWGEGSGNTTRSADKEALSDLISKKVISLNEVKSGIFHLIQTLRTTEMVGKKRKES